MLLLCGLLQLSGCSEPGPELENIELALEKYLDERNLSDVFTLSDLQILNSKKVNNTAYTFQVSYGLTARQDLNTLLESLTGSKLDMTDHQRFMQKQAYRMHYGNFSEGDRVNKQEVLQMVSSNDSWRVNR